MLLTAVASTSSYWAAVVLPGQVVVVIDHESLGLPTGEGRLGQVRRTDDDPPQPVPLKQIYLCVGNGVLHNEEASPAVGYAVVQYLPPLRTYSGNGYEAPAEPLVYLLLEVDDLARFPS